MQKAQWYVMSGVSFLLTLFFGGMASNRKRVCDNVVEILRQVCLERRTTYIIFGIIFLVLSVGFLISGLFQRK